MEAWKLCASETMQGYMAELEGNIIPKLCSPSIVIKWIKGGKRDMLGTPEEYYCHIIITDSDKRAEVISVLENHLANHFSSKIEGYVVGRHSIAVVPRLEDGPEIGNNTITFDG